MYRDHKLVFSSHFCTVIMCQKHFLGSELYEPCSVRCCRIRLLYSFISHLTKNQKWHTASFFQNKRIRLIFLWVQNLEHFISLMLRAELFCSLLAEPLVRQHLGWQKVDSLFVFLLFFAAQMDTLWHTIQMCHSVIFYVTTYFNC